MTNVGTAVGSTATAGLAFDNPEAYISRDRRRALAEGLELPDRVRGAALFADISGFTPLTEALAEEFGAQRGAEELTARLNLVFHALIDDLDRMGGDVISFSGDAITCWLDGDDGSRATACALAMQKTMDRISDAVTPAATNVRLAMKVAVAVGPARRFVVGDPEIQLIDVLAGRLVDLLAAAERHAREHEVVLEQSALEALGDRVEIGERRLDSESGRTVGVVSGLPSVPAALPLREPDESLSEELVRPWILPAVYERLRTGRGEFLAELRPAIPIFVHFAGIDYDEDDDAAAKLDDFVRRAQRICAEYGGNLLQMTIGDKGAYLYAVFGSPHAHEDDGARAAAAALDLRALDRVTEVSDLKIGIAHGRLRSGTYGHAMRRTFVCLGDAVNLAARLMAHAAPGQVYVAESAKALAGASFTWEVLPNVRVKGKAEPVAVYALTGTSDRTSRRRKRYELEIVGRQAELTALAAALERTLELRGNVVGISAEAGLGKSRLVAEFVRAVRAGGGFVAFGECPAFGTNSDYFVWQEIWRSLLGVDEGRTEAEQRVAVERTLEEIDPTFVQRSPLLGPLLGISIPENDLTGSFDAKLRKTSLESLLADCLRARAAEEFVVIVLEDCHWIGPLARDLLTTLVRATAALPVLFVLAYRPAAAPGGALGLEQLPQFTELPLGELEPAEAEQLVRSKLAQLFGGATDASPALLELVMARSQGNPFYVEELLNYVHGKGVDPQDEARLRDLELPGSLHSLILSRVDTLGEAPRRTLKVASVVGRSFLAPALPSVYPELGTPADVAADLATLRALDLVALDRDDAQSYIFKHVVTQEVAYESMPFSTRAMLHERVGDYIEEAEADTIGLQLDLLAHHYWHSENQEKKREYLVRAGEAAEASYANAAAIDYLERAAPLGPADARVDVLLKLGKVVELVGDWGRAEEVDREALATAEQLGDARASAWCETALAEVARRQGRYDDALSLLEHAAQSFESVGEDGGVGQVQHLMGTLAAQQGDYPKAIESYEASLAIRRRLEDKAGMAGLLSNLGVVAEYRGDFRASREYHEQALALRSELDDRRAIAVSMTNLGTIAVLEHEYEDARAYFEDAMRLNREVGDAWMVAISDNNLGNATRGLGDFAAAQRHYADSLRAYREYDDKWALAFLVEDIGQLAAMCGDAEQAFELVGAADALREEIGTPRAPGLEEELERHLAPARSTLGDEAAAEARGRGQSLTPPDVFALALRVCDADPDPG
jgi:predicted ATPase/class 3 adenylate cyclase